MRRAAVRRRPEPTGQLDRRPQDGRRAAWLLYRTAGLCRPEPVAEPGEAGAELAPGQDRLLGAPLAQAVLQHGLAGREQGLPGRLVGREQRLKRAVEEVLVLLGVP